MKITRSIKISIGFISAAAVAGVLHFAFSRSQSFAAAWRTGAGAFFRSVVSGITSFIPFSLAEVIVVSAPLAALFLILACVARSSTKREALLRIVSFAVSVASLIYALFVLMYIPGFYTRDIGLEFGIERRDVTLDELYLATVKAVEEVNRESDMITEGLDGASHMPFTVRELSEKLSDLYDSLADEYSFPSRMNTALKPIALSEPMTYTHLSGIYSFFTGEANINVNYPDYTVVYTSAHEMAHQRGIAREDEANFVAFLVCERSLDHYIRYSAYLNIYEYLASALYSVSPEKYSDAVMQLSDTARNELRAYSKMFDKYRDNSAAAVTDAVNSAYLTTFTGNDTRSYGMVVDLATLYLIGE